ncbi:phosphotransferase system lactose/cellobiose-specific iib subunit [Enterococcus canis]|uniref:Phosphotransferase system lactose/cellobiose-specific iib subunit n=2 Tax=Enterococcus canis TaxID=214095 RepID=A0A1L8RF16_9ENTE|nr:phosphotransferase system lactose/cellobiose-specific iib subunit [Enterococcus canis]
MLMERMRQAATQQGLEVTIDATAEGRVDKMIEEIDVLLLGPQVGYLEDTLKTKYAGHDVVIKTIPSIDYGMMNGEKVLHDALVLE